VLGCAAPLLDGELVLGADVAATVTEGGPGARLGATVAWDDGAWVATAPGAREVWRDGDAADAAATAAGWWDGEVVVVDAEGTARIGDAVVAEVPGARLWAIGPNGLAAATSGEVVFGGVRRDLAGATALAWGAERLLAVASRRVHAWDLDGNALDVDLAAGEGGAVGEWDGVAWAGDPEDDDDDGAGRVCDERGDCVEGLPGDHLGGAIGGGFAAGTFNKWVVPARARIVPLAGGVVYAMEEGAEIQPLVLDGDESGLCVGAPWFPAHGEPSGAVVEVTWSE
jgi:hypothetical protein